MIADLKPYTEYQNSSQVWLGDVPAHWNVLSNRGVFSEVKERGHSDASMLSVTIKRGIIRQADLLSETSKKDSSNIDKSKYKLVRPNDLAYNKMRAWQGALGVSSLRGIISPAYVVMRPHVECQPKYFHYLYRTPGFAKEAERWSYGITSDMWSLRPEHFKMIYTLLPPPDEQALIVRFLDWASVRLGKAIAAKRKVIGLLEEQKQAIIHRAVTRGLDDTVALKPSGLDWLGDVPEQWEVRKLGRIARVTNGSTPSRFIPAYWQNGTIPWLASGKVNDYVVRTASEMITKEALRDCSVRIVPSGSIIIGMVGQGKTRGMSAITDIDACVNQNLAAVVPNPKALIPMYLLHVVTASYSFIRELGRGGNQEALNTQMIGGLRVPVPPLAEQQGIANAIEEQTNGISFIKLKFEKEIALLREYQTRLISDVVTGSLDVRAFARSLPDDVSEEAAELAATETLDEDFATDDELIEEAV